MAISVLWGMQALSHLFVVFRPTPSLSFPPTAEQQTTLLQGDYNKKTAESMNKLNRCLSPFFFFRNGGLWTVVQLLVKRTQKCWWCFNLFFHGVLHHVWEVWQWQYRSLGASLFPCSLREIACQLFLNPQPSGCRWLSAFPECLAVRSLGTTEYKKKKNPFQFN